MFDIFLRKNKEKLGNWSTLAPHYGATTAALVPNVLHNVWTQNDKNNEKIKKKRKKEKSKKEKEKKKPL